MHSCIIIPYPRANWAPLHAVRTTLLTFQPLVISSRGELIARRIGSEQLHEGLHITSAGIAWALANLPLETR